jgi:hypothetical protein
VPVAIMVTRTRVGGGGGKGRHNTRRTELERLVERVIRRVTGAGDPDGFANSGRQMDDGARFRTRNMPAWAQEPDALSDALGAHAFGWESDVALAEARLEREARRGYLEARDAGPVPVRSPSERALAALAPPRAAAEALSPDERAIINFRAYVEMRDHEESYSARRGRGRPLTGYEVVFSFDLPVTNRDVLTLVEAFLERPMEVAFNRRRGPESVDNPLRDLPAGIAIHAEGTGVVHAHALFDMRDASGRAVQIPPQVWRSFDEHWARVWSEFARDPELFREHIRKKAETLEWKRDARERAERNLPPAPKPERAADLRDQEELKLRSQIRTDLRTAGLDPEEFRIAERPVVRRANDRFARLAAGLGLAEERFVHALATGAPLEEARLRGEEADRLAGAVELARAARARAGKWEEPPALHTDREAREVTRLGGERAEAALDDTKAALLVGNYEYVRAYDEVSRRKAARRTSDEVRDGGGRPGRDERRRRLVGRAAEEAKEARSRRGLKTPGPTYWAEVYDALDYLGHRERDAQVARRLREQCRGHRLAPSRVRETAEVELGRELVAAMLMAAAAEAWKAAAAEYERGRRKSEDERGRLLASAKAKEGEYVEARRYHEERRAGVDECLRAMGVERSEVAPRLAAEELEALREFATRTKKADGRGELSAALDRAEEASRRRLRAEELWAREPLPDVEAARLTAEAHVARRRAESARLAFERYERKGEFQVRQVPVGDDYEPWSLALAVNSLEEGNDYKHLPRVVDLLRDEVGKRTDELRTEAEECERNARVLEERLRDALEVREAHGLARPAAEYTLAQERALEQLILETRDAGTLEELSGREFGRDAARAAGRSLAREVVMTLRTYDADAAYDGPDQMIAEDVGNIPWSDPLRAKMEAYLECRREERESSEVFLRACREIAARQQARSLELTGREAAALFTAGEHELVVGKVSQIRDDREHDRVAKEVNRARVLNEHRAFEPTEPLPFRTFQVDEGAPRMRAGLLMGYYLCRQAEFIELHRTKQPYSERLHEADRAKREMETAVAHHRDTYSAKPVAIFSCEQADYVTSVTRRFTGLDVLNLGDAARGAAVIGRSRPDYPIEVASPTLQRDAGGLGQPRDTLTRQTPDRRENRGGNGGRSSRW